MVPDKQGGARILTSISQLHRTSPEVALCRFLKDDGLRPIVVAPQAGNVENLTAEGAEVLVLPGINRWRNLKWRLLSPWLIGKLASIASHNNVKLVHAARLSVTPFAVKVAQRIHRPAISHIHGLPGESSKFTRYLVEQADAVVGVSRAALANYSPVTGQQVKVIYNGLDIERFCSQANEFDIREKYKITGNPLLGISGAYHLKGLDLIVEAAPTITQQFPQAQFIVLGNFRGRDYQEQIERRLNLLKLTEHFIFAGAQENVAPFMAAADLWLVPSRVDAAPMVALEAMSLGKAVVGSDVGGIPELVRDGKDGLIVPREDPGALAKVVCNLLADKIQLQLLGEAAKARVKQEFSTEVFNCQMGALYDALLGGER